jgi:hypothetical protein
MHKNMQNALRIRGTSFDMPRTRMGAARILFMVTAAKSRHGLLNADLEEDLVSHMLRRRSILVSDNHSHAKDRHQHGMHRL